MSQDMPPPGGFATINIERTLPKPILRQSIWAAILIGLTVNGMFVIKEWKKKYRILKLEQIEHYVAVQPFLVAEQERKFLQRLRVLRDEERELMKDYPGWIVGTLFGEPVYKTLPKGSLPPVSVSEYIGNRTKWELVTKVIIPDLHK